MKIYTKTGDQGQTSLYGGKRVCKSDLRIDSIGHVDELNAYIGLLSSFETDRERIMFLTRIQNNLFTVGALLAADTDKPGLKLPELSHEETRALEDQMDKMSEALAPMTAFILPGGNQHIAYGHIARAVCRRAERSVVGLTAENSHYALIITYLNRLSDYLFILCRKIAQEAGIEEMKWLPVKN